MGVKTPSTLLAAALAALASLAAACATETRVVRGSPDTTLPEEEPEATADDPPAQDDLDRDAASSPSKDAGPATKDAGGSDAKPPPPPPANADLGRVHCSASGGAPSYCAAGAVCCVQNAVKQLAPLALSCETFNGCKSRPDPLPLVCDGPEDCKAGEHCYAITTPAIALTSLCTTTPLSSEWRRLCNPSASGECAAGEACVPTTTAPAVGVCR
jgi:hypothetical protein